MRSQLVTTELERAARLIYLNKTCFNGLYREKSKGLFNVSIEKYNSPKVCHTSLLGLTSVTLQSAQIEVRPFDTVMDHAKSDDLVYFESPYYPLSPTSNFTAYDYCSFNEFDQIRLENKFVELAGRGVKVMLSNSNCLFIRELYNNFRIYKIAAARAINSTTGKRGKITKILITSYCIE